MVRVVWKYEIPMLDSITFSLQMPKGAWILGVQNQLESPKMWALVDQHAPLELRRFLLAYTGRMIDEDELQYVGTVLLSGGSLVVHLFEVV